MRAQAMRLIGDLDVATPDEVAVALGALTPIEISRLNMIARIRVRYAPGLEWRELLHEAIDKALSGARKWPRHLPFLLFMHQTMRSQASEHRRKAAFGLVTTEADLPARADGDSIIGQTPSRAPSQERDVFARQMLDQVLSVFAGDPAALAALDGLAMGLDPAEIQKNAGITKTQYASAQKRIRRGLVHAFPEGSPL
jgi:hypothetical protein